MFKISSFLAAFALFVTCRLITGDECVPNPCKNGGTCQFLPIPGGYNWNYTCVCPSEFIGDQCQWDKRNCSDDTVTPCQNDGRCVMAQDGRFCLCPGSTNTTIMYGGYYCEIADPCSTCPESTAFCHRLDRCVRGRMCLNSKHEIITIE